MALALMLLMPFFPLNDGVLYSSIVRDFLIAGTPLVILLATAVVRSLQLEKGRPIMSMRARIPKSNPKRRRSLLVYLCCSLLAVGGHVALLLMGAYEQFTSILTLPLAFVGMLVFSLHDLRETFVMQKTGAMTASIANYSAKRFIKRHRKERQAWATTVGIKTANFIINHDPDYLLRGNLPATIYQIRSEEIQRCVAEVLGQKYLHANVIGNKVMGALDPEISLRSCVDMLKLFSCLYLDATQLVERRIKCITSLLPIVDPGLARIVTEEMVTDLVRRSIWFFYFDFTWLEQHLVHTKRSTRYDVQIATLPSSRSRAMLTHSKKMGGIGNVMWMSPGARSRLLQEAPEIGSIITATPIKVSKDQDEELYFTCRFEQLIPRLQRYFNLDSMRKNLLDFDPTPESLRLQNLLGLQIDKADPKVLVDEILDSISSVPWQGFKEKDSALLLILKIYSKIQADANEPITKTSKSSQNRKAHAKLLQTVTRVGYPSQLLHLAQIEKLTLRDLQRLLDAASDSGHSRFEEAWLYLATMEFKNSSEKQIKDVLKLINRVSHSTSLNPMPLVQAKSINVLSNLAPFATRVSKKLFDTTVERMGIWLATKEADAEICCLYLDCINHVESVIGERLVISKTTLSRLDDYIKALENHFGTNHPNVIAIQGRWQDLRVGGENQAS